MASNHETAKMDLLTFDRLLHYI